MQDWPIIVIIDGECALCNTAAVWFAHRDRRSRMLFAPNQGQAARIADEPPGGDAGTIVVWAGSRRLIRSTAVLRMLESLGGGWAFLATLGRWCPCFFRDWLYDQIACRRRRLSCAFGGKLLSPHHLAE